ncbi:hypothetical protein D9M69_617710 [compost metagenome]
MALQFAAFAGQADGLLAGFLGGVQFLHHIGEEQDALRRQADGLGDALVGRRLALAA